MTRMSELLRGDRHTVNKRTILKLLEMNLNVDGYRGVVVASNQYIIEKDYLTHLCKQPHLKFNKMENEVKNVNNDARVRFYLSNTRFERVRGLKIHHCFIDDIGGNKELLGLIESKAKNVEYIKYD